MSVFKWGKSRFSISWDDKKISSLDPVATLTQSARARICALHFALVPLLSFTVVCLAL